MEFTDPIPFTEAIKHLLVKRLLPTTMDSAALRVLDAALRRQSLFSAETTYQSYLGTLKDAIESIIAPKQVTRLDEEGRPLPHTVTEGHNPATARARLRDTLRSLGYAPSEDIEDTIKDLSSDLRLDLVVKTNVELAQGAGHFVRANSDADVLDLWPAWELVRFEDRQVPRDWAQRWRIAAQTANDPEALACMVIHGRMCALKSSGIWQELGDGAGGYTDTLGNPYPPFAFNSGMWTEDVSRAEAVELDLIGEDEKAEPAEFDLSSLFAPPG